MTGIEMIDVKPADDEHVLTQVYVTGKKTATGFDAWFSFWTNPPVVKNLSFFIKPRGIKEKLIDSDSAITKIFACLKAGCKIKMSVILCKKHSIESISTDRFEMKLVGTEVILEPVA
jgi:hypothetical protein